MRVTRHRVGASAIRLLSVTAAAATACALWAGTASAATASVSRQATSTSMSISPKTQWVGAGVTLSATVRSATRARGTVTFKSGRTTLCHGSLLRGSTRCRTSFGHLGTYGVRAYYAGNATHKPSTSGIARVHIIRSGTSTSITKITPTPVRDGMVAVITVKVTGRAGTPVPTGTVKVAPTNVIGSTAGYVCSATLVHGQGSCSVTPPVPSYGLVDYRATYLGNAAHLRSESGTTVLPVQETTMTTVAPKTATAGTVTLTATVVTAGEADISPPYGSGSVTFYNGTTAIAGCVAVSPTDPSKGEDNVATCTTTLAAGTYTINAVYSGDDVNLTSTGTVTLVVS
ncbi:MAG TPA: Ig-like domain-containing protein [Streptosporangiaceae bacterium]|nr:Ig-like domain-containing protein [Streptosporangiaceae bacterium]